MNVLLSILGIGFLIFIHELGHFLAAKKVGIRVETFAIGFQPTIFGWRARLIAVQRGETEYVIGLVPFGGYVKMAGEELDDPRTGSDDEYASKSPSQRALVLVAGATMNLIFGFILFMLAFSMGVSFSTTEVGFVAPGQPAWEAGIRPGDKVLSIAGDPKREFSNVQTSIALAKKNQELEVVLERPRAGSDPEIVTTIVRPAFNRSRGMLGVGIGPATGSKIQSVAKGSAAEKAGLQSGDDIRSLTFVWGEGKRFAVPENWVFDRAIHALASFVQSS